MTTTYIDSPCPSSECGGTISWFPMPEEFSTCSKCGSSFTRALVLESWRKSYMDDHRDLSASLAFQPGDLYFYRAKIIRIVDGDTFEAAVDLGFRTTVTEKFRLLNFDTAEPTWRAANDAELSHGLLASQMVKDLLLDREFIITTRKTGKYGRWLADVVLGGDLSDPYMLTQFLLDHNMHKLESYAAYGAYIAEK